MLWVSALLSLLWFDLSLDRLLWVPVFCVNIGVYGRLSVLGGDCKGWLLDGSPVGSCVGSIGPLLGTWAAAPRE